MCNFFSLILTKDYAYSGPTDSHTDIIAYHKLREWDKCSNRPTLVKYEVLPPDEGLSAPYHEWKIVVDQDVFPEWYAPETDRARVLEAVGKIDPWPAWKAYKAVVGPAWKAYKAVQGPAREAYDAVVGSAWETYQAVERFAWEAYQAIRGPAREAYEAVVGPAWEAYKKAITRKVRV